MENNTNSCFYLFALISTVEELEQKHIDKNKTIDKYKSQVEILKSDLDKAKNEKSSEG